LLCLNISNKIQVSGRRGSDGLWGELKNSRKNALKFSALMSTVLLVC